MRRALGAIVVMGVIGLWKAIDALSLRPLSSPCERVMPDETSRAFHQPAKFDSLLDLEPRVPRGMPAASSFHADPLAFLSTAPTDSLDLLPGIGPVLAGRIIDARRARGGFASWNDVLAIKGVGPATIARWRALAGQ